MTQAILRRNGASFSLDSTPVRQAFEAMQEEGLIRVVGRDDAWFKMLGDE